MISVTVLTLLESNLHRFGIVILLNIFAQVTGSNIVSYVICNYKGYETSLLIIISSYAGVVFEGAGITDTYTQMVVNIGINVFCFFCAFGGSFAIERLGRKAMLCKSLLFPSI
jgi:ATP-dependent protease ClpP protease subunit